MNYFPQVNGPQIGPPTQATLYPGDVQTPFPPSPHRFASWVTDSDESVHPGSADNILAMKFSWIYNTVRHKVVYDRHCALAFRPIIQRASNPSTTWNDVRRRLTYSPPQVIAIENIPSERNVTGHVLLQQYPDVIFINVRYIQALERSGEEFRQSSNVSFGSDTSTLIALQSANYTCLSFVLFSSLMHELGHWVNDLATDGRDSGISMQFENYWGQDIREPGSLGESGFFLEGQLFGGVICHGGIVDESEPTFTLRARTCAFEDIVVIGMNHMRNSKEAYYIRKHHFQLPHFILHTHRFQH